MNQTTTSEKPIDNMSFEEAITELERIVKIIESGTGELEETINAYEKGAKLRTHCLNKLNDAKLKIEVIEKNSETQEISLKEIEIR